MRMLVALPLAAVLLTPAEVFAFTFSDGRSAQCIAAGRAVSEVDADQGSGADFTGKTVEDAGEPRIVWNRAKLAGDSCVEDAGGWGGVTLAHNVASREEVDAVTEEARAAGATIGREPAETFYGGYAGVFHDPDGHAWEIAHNPYWTVRDDGSVSLAGD